MHVPTGTGRPTAGLAGRRADPAVHGHEAHAGLHHPPGEQQVLTERVHAVTLADGQRLLLQVESRAPFRPGHRVVGQLAQFMPVLGLRFFCEAVRLQGVEQLAPFLHPGGITGIINLGQLELRHRRVVVGGANKHRCVTRTQITAGAEVRSAEDWRSHALDEPRVGDQVALVGKMLGHHRSDVGQVVGDTFADALDDLPAQQIVHGVEVIVDRARMRHRADEAELIGHLGEFGMQFAQLHAFRSHVSIWLGPPHSSTKMQHFFEATALPDLSNLSLPTTNPGTARLSNPTPPALSAVRREVLGRFIDMAWLT